jgi:hypothetical protein
VNRAVAALRDAGQLELDEIFHDAMNLRAPSQQAI